MILILIYQEINKTLILVSHGWSSYVLDQIQPDPVDIKTDITITYEGPDDADNDIDPVEAFTGEYQVPNGADSNLDEVLTDIITDLNALTLDPEIQFSRFDTDTIRAEVQEPGFYFDIWKFNINNNGAENSIIPTSVGNIDIVIPDGQDNC